MHENRSSSKKTTMLSLFLVCLAAVDIALTTEEKTEESRSQFDVFCDFGSEDRKKLLVCISSASNQAKTLLSKQGRSIDNFASEVCKQNKEQFPQDIQNHLEELEAAIKTCVDKLNLGVVE